MNKDNIILVVDDSQVQLKRTLFILEKANYSVFSAQDGTEALKLLNNRHPLPRLIITDIVMPNMDGYELCAKVKKNYPNIPIIVLTSHNDEDGLKKAFSAGAVDYLDIPFSKTELLVRINNILERVRAENLLRESEKRFRDIAYSTSDWIWEVDEEGMYTYCSENVQELMGYTIDEVMGKSLFNFRTEEGAEKIRTFFGEIFRKRKPIVNLENWNVRKDDKRVCLLTFAIPFFDEQEVFRGYRGVDRDITENKKEKSKRKIDK